MADVEIKLSAEPDGMGFLHGESRWLDTVVRINLVPPAPLFRSQSPPTDDYQPDKTRWRVWADGEEIGSLDTTREELIPALEQLLMFGEGTSA